MLPKSKALYIVHAQHSERTNVVTSTVVLKTQVHFLQHV